MPAVAGFSRRSPIYVNCLFPMLFEWELSSMARELTNPKKMILPVPTLLAAMAYEMLKAVQSFVTWKSFLETRRFVEANPSKV